MNYLTDNQKKDCIVICLAVIVLTFTPSLTSFFWFDGLNSVTGALPWLEGGLLSLLWAGLLVNKKFTFSFALVIGAILLPIIWIANLGLSYGETYFASLLARGILSAMASASWAFTFLNDNPEN